MVLGRNKGGYRIFDPRSTIDANQLRRPSPTTDGVRGKDRRHIDELADRYMDFINSVRIPSQVVDEVQKITEEHYYEGDQWYTNSLDSAFAFFRQGQKPFEEGMRVLFAHTDSVCLRTKVKPAILNWDPDDQGLYTGAMLDTFLYGGPNPHQWTGMPLQLQGWAHLRNNAHWIDLPTYSAETHAHTDMRGVEEESFTDAHAHETLDLDTGFYTIKTLLEATGLLSIEEFARARLFAVPTTSCTKVGQDYITGYGHDARSGVFASLEALLQLNKRPVYDTFILGFDKEEVGSQGSGGADNTFFEEILYSTMIEAKYVDSRKEITNAMLLPIIKRSLAINTDVDAGATHRDLEEGRIDKRNIAKLGYGPFINATSDVTSADQVSPIIVGYVMDALKDQRVICDVVGSPMVADLSDEVETMNVYMQNRGFPTINVGIPISSMHSPNEMLHIGDLYHAVQAYTALLQTY